LKYFDYPEKPIFFLSPSMLQPNKSLVMLHVFEIFWLLKRKAKLNCVKLVVEERKSYLEPIVCLSETLFLVKNCIF